MFDEPIEHPPEYEDYFRLFNERDFFEAHEVLEDLWVMEVGYLRNYYKGLIMMAVAILHWQRGNRRGSLRLYHDSMDYLIEYPEKIEGFHLDDFRHRMKDLFRPLTLAPKEADPPEDSEIPLLEIEPAA